MITGHIGIALAAHRRWPATPILVLLVASVFPDVVDVAKALAGVHVGQGLYSHTVPAVALQALVLGGATALRQRSVSAGAGVALVVGLHLPADYLTGWKPLWAGGPEIGFSLYQRPVVDFVLEALLVLLAWVPLRRSAATPRWVRSPAVLVLLLAVQGTANVAALARQGDVGRVLRRVL